MKNHSKHFPLKVDDAWLFWHQISSYWNKLSKESIHLKEVTPVQCSCSADRQNDVKNNSKKPRINEGSRVKLTVYFHLIIN